jgi:arabinogalactan endo-1,4-beta-galactosidase
MKPRYALYLVIISLISVAPIIAQDAQGSTSSPFYMGVDLSYVNEMVDCGAVYRVDGEARDPYDTARSTILSGHSKAPMRWA